MDAMRRHVLAGLALAPLASGSAAFAGAQASAALTIYSPAPPTHPMHALNLNIRDAAAAAAGLGAIDVVPLALPASIEAIQSQGGEQSIHLPIVPAIDFGLIRAGAGPDWHRYPRGRPDLKFVSSLYEVGFGVYALRDDIRTPNDLRGKRIGVPPRPSSVRLLSEILIGQGWMLSDVVLVDIAPDQAAGALARGDIDATTWNLVLPGTNGFAPSLATAGNGHFLDIDMAAIERINGANPFSVGSADLPGGLNLLSFAQALTAWDETDAAVLTALLEAMAVRGGAFTGLQDTRLAMSRWPGLTQGQTHVVAASFYADGGPRVR